MVVWQEENPETDVFFLQLPPMVPMIKQSSTVENMGSGNVSEQNSASQTRQKTCSMNELPSGSMGKLLVYRSGAVKLKLGDIIYDVSLFIYLFIVFSHKHEHAKFFVIYSFINLNDLLS